MDILISGRDGLWQSFLFSLNIRSYKCRACHDHFHWPLTSFDDADAQTEYTPSPVRIARTTPRTATPVRPQRRRVARAAVAMRSKWFILAAVTVMLALGIYFFRSSSNGNASDEYREQGFVIEEHVNRPGFDFAAFALKQSQPELCAEYCRKEYSCNAFTFVKPLVEGAAAMCYLKTAAAAPTVDKQCITGVKGR